MRIREVMDDLDDQMPRTDGVRHLTSSSSWFPRTSPRCPAWKTTERATKRMSAPTYKYMAIDLVSEMPADVNTKRCHLATIHASQQGVYMENRACRHARRGKLWLWSPEADPQPRPLHAQHLTPIYRNTLCTPYRQPHSSPQRPL